MNKQQIKSELRRSACEDEIPWHGVSMIAWASIVRTGFGVDVMAASNEDQRTFFLLVAETIE